MPSQIRICRKIQEKYKNKQIDQRVYQFSYKHRGFLHNLGRDYTIYILFLEKTTLLTSVIYFVNIRPIEIICPDEGHFKFL